MASPSSTDHRLPVVVSPYADEPSMPASATGTLFVLASGFGIGALLVLFGFVFLIGIGDIGHKEHMVFTALGDSVNVAARLKDLAKDLRCEVVISADVWQRAGLAAPEESFQQVRIRGRDDPLAVYAAQRARLEDAEYLDQHVLVPAER